MLSWRAFAASAVIIAATITSSHAAPGNALLVPVEISGLPAGINLVSLNCHVTDANNNNVAFGNAMIAPIGGRVSETLTVPLGINRSAIAVTGAATGYWCRVALTGTAPAGHAVTFWSTTALTSTGWRNIFGARDQTTYLPGARGATHAMDVRGTLTAEQANLIAPVATTACPCGCGATSGSANSMCAPGLASGILSGSAVPSATGGLRQPNASTRPAIRTTDAPPPAPPPPIVQVATPAFRFTGTGVFTRG